LVKKKGDENMEQITKITMHSENGKTSEILIEPTNLNTIKGLLSQVVLNYADYPEVVQAYLKSGFKLGARESYVGKPTDRNLI